MSVVIFRFLKACMPKNKTDDYLYKKSLKSALKTGFLVNNNYLSLQGQIKKFYMDIM